MSPQENLFLGRKAITLRGEFKECRVHVLTTPSLSAPTAIHTTPNIALKKKKRYLKLYSAKDFKCLSSKIRTVYDSPSWKDSASPTKFCIILFFYYYYYFIRMILYFMDYRCDRSNSFSRLIFVYTSFTFCFFFHPPFLLYLLLFLSFFFFSSSSSFLFPLWHFILYASQPTFFQFLFFFFSHSLILPLSVIVIICLLLCLFYLRSRHSLLIYYINGTH